MCPTEMQILHSSAHDDQHTTVEGSLEEMVHAVYVSSRQTAKVSGDMFIFVEHHLIGRNCEPTPPSPLFPVAQIAPANESRQDGHIAPVEVSSDHRAVGMRRRWCSPRWQQPASGSAI